MKKGKILANVVVSLASIVGPYAREDARVIKRAVREKIKEEGTMRYIADDMLFDIFMVYGAGDYDPNDGSFVPSSSAVLAAENEYERYKRDHSKK